MTNCCNRPSITTMHEFKTVINADGRYEKESCINRLCTNCYTHWYGHPDSLKTYTKSEWDEMVNHCFDDCRIQDAYEQTDIFSNVGRV